MNKKTFKELRDDRRMRAVIKLCMWGIFFLLMFIFLAVASLFNKAPSDTLEEENKVEIVSANIPLMLENLILSNYTYEYKINTENISYSYTGSKENGEIKGYYESTNGIIKYIIKDNNYYELNNDELIENSTIITEEDKNILDLNNLLNLIKEYENDNEVKQEENIYTYDIVDDEKSYQIIITTKTNDIEKIVINYNNINYDLIFKNIKSVTE